MPPPGWFFFLGALASVPWLETGFEHFIVAHFYSAFETETTSSITDFLPKSIGLSYSCAILNEIRYRSGGRLVYFEGMRSAVLYNHSWA